ncbi:preQ0 transporter [Pseudomonas sp.]|uniref:preQ0 transporter n=1 Tax=Pseudomonas sp. TaxID=306 RepID=UPI00258B83A3|nr:preQ0 transporter [Pseudomonas sp.]
MLFLLSYIASVVLINFAFSAAPHLDIIWSAWGGLVFILRDMVQARFGHGAFVAMLVALVLSYVTSEPAIALASATAFGLSELIDWLVFTVTRRPLHDRLWISSALSIPLDTFIFFGMIGALTPPVVLTALGSKFAGVTCVWLAMAWRSRRTTAASRLM